VIDPTAGSGSTLIAALELNRKAYGFEIDKNFYKSATKWIEQTIQRKKDIEKYGFPKTEMDKETVNLFTDWELPDFKTSYTAPISNFKAHC
jgi:site-specific DNA-methyltransferase (adenine-specific)